MEEKSDKDQGAEKREDSAISFRTGKISDHARVISVMPQWWGGRDLTHMLPKLFFVHFTDSIFIAEKESELIAFLVGFLSQSRPDEAYIHFAGVHPDFRGKGLGAMLYKHFFEFSQKYGRRIIRSCTSPVNKMSVAFHKRMGFDIEPGDSEADGIPVSRDYNRKGDPKVLFVKR